MSVLMNLSCSVEGSTTRLLGPDTAVGCDIGCYIGCDIGQRLVQRAVREEVVAVPGIVTMRHPAVTLQDRGDPDDTPHTEYDGVLRGTVAVEIGGAAEQVRTRAWRHQLPQLAYYRRHQLGRRAHSR